MRDRVILLLFLAVAGCDDAACPMVDPNAATPPPPDPKMCDLGFMPGPNEVAIAPAATCASGACLRLPLEHDLPMCSVYPQGSKGLCTGACETDADCAGLEGPCATGYTCGVATTVGPYSCQRLCMCKDYVAVTSVTPAPCAH